MPSDLDTAAMTIFFALRSARKKPRNMPSLERLENAVRKRADDWERWERAAALDAYERGRER